MKKPVEKVIAFYPNHYRGSDILEAKGLTMAEAQELREKIKQAIKATNSQGYFQTRIRARGPRTGPECEAYAELMKRTPFKNRYGTWIGRGADVRTYGHDLPLALGKHFSLYINDTGKEWKLFQAYFNDRNLFMLEDEKRNFARERARSMVKQKYAEVISYLKNIV